MIVTKGNLQRFQDDTDVVALLKACAKQKDLHKGSRIHADVLRRGVLTKSIYIGNTLIYMYAKCGALAKAQQVFDELPARDIVSWNALITAYAQHGHIEQALNVFKLVRRYGLCPDAVTYACILKACMSIGAADMGKEIHAEIIREGWLGKDIVLGNVLIDMYAKCDALTQAQQVFDELPIRDVASWTSLIGGYAQHMHGQEALNYFEQMKHEGLSPDAMTFACVLKACGSIGAAEKGEEMHDEIVRKGLLGSNSLLETALVDMYSRCGELTKAQQVFDGLPLRHVVPWTALIAGYCQHGHCEEAMNYFQRMQLEGFSPNAMTYVHILKACGSIGAAEKGKQIHAEIVREGLLRNNSMIGTALVDMYTKCGALARAQQVFDELAVRDVVSWTALLAGYAQLGKHDTVFDGFKVMIREGIKPNLVTLTVVLNACSYSGLVDEGKSYFEIMSASFGINPTLEHHACMVDLFGNAGHFDKAMRLIRKIPSSEYLPVWLSLLGACRKWGNLKLGKLAFEQAVCLDKKSAVAYVCMSTIYAAAGMEEDADKIEAYRIKNEAWKKPGHCWWTDPSGNVHSFSVGDTGHKQGLNILAKVEDIAFRISQKGYCPDLQWVLQDISDDAKWAC